MRRYKNGSPEDTDMVCITFRTQALPDYITIERTSIKVKYFFPNVRLCYKCGQLRHAKTFCKQADENCLNCGELRRPNGQ